MICVQRRYFGRIEDRQKVQFALFPWIERSVIRLPLDSRLVLQHAEPRPRLCFRARCKRAVSRIDMCQCGVFIRRKFPARSAFAPQVLNFFFVRSRLLCAIARWARDLQCRELSINFFIQLLYRLAIPRMRTRYFISKLSCQRRLYGEAKAIGGDTWLSRPRARSLRCRRGSALSAIFTRMSKATWGSRITASIKSIGVTLDQPIARPSRRACKLSFCSACLSVDRHAVLLALIPAWLFLCYFTVQLWANIRKSSQ